MSDVIVTIPAYNEEESIGAIVRDIKRELDLNSLDAQVHVISDGSTDTTEKEAKLAGALVYLKPHTGLADTFRHEMRVACDWNPRIIVHTDADGQYAAADIPGLVALVDAGYDMVLGNRLHRRPKGMPLRKYIINKFGAAEFSLLLHQRLPDIATGFRAFTPEVARLPIVSQYTYTHEQIYRAAKAGFRLHYHDIVFSPRVMGESRLIGKGIYRYIRREAQDWMQFMRGTN